MLSCGHLCSSLCGEQCTTNCPECITGSFPEDSQIALPCGHHFSVKLLDEIFGLDKVYKIDDNGNIDDFAQESIETSFMDPKCPACNSSCKNVRRYAILYQLHNLNDSVDCAQEYFSRRIHKFLGNINLIRGELDFSFDGFRNGLRPGPLAARRNESMILQRGNAFVEVEATIQHFKGTTAFLTLVLKIDKRHRNVG